MPNWTNNSFPQFREAYLLFAFCWSSQRKLRFWTHAKIAPREVQVPGLGRHSEEYRKQRVTHDGVPSPFLHVIVRRPKSSDFHVKSRDSDWQISHLLRFHLLAFNDRVPRSQSLDSPLIIRHQKWLTSSITWFHRFESVTVITGLAREKKRGEEWSMNYASWI